jgi:hypothetical protein
MAETGPETIKKASFPQYREGGEIIKPLLERSKILSRQSRVKTEQKGEKVQGEERTLALRRIRRELVNKVAETSKQDKDTRKSIIAEGHARDQIAEDFMNAQREVRVGIGELGEQMARFVVLTPPESRRTEQLDSKPPIFIVPGISNDLESMGMLPQEIAFEGRKVVLIGFPESWHGEVTVVFGKATEESQSYEPHTAFFKKAIEAVRQEQEVKNRIGEPSDIELWGYSTGAAIVAEILTDSVFREKVSNAAIICPPSCVDQENLKIFGQEIPLPKAMVQELVQTFKNYRNASKRNVTNRREIEFTKDHRERMLKTYNALRKKVLRRNDWLEKDLQVKKGGTITLVSYDKDQLTKSYSVVDEIKQNPNLKVIELSGGHGTPLSNSETLINAVSSQQL